MDHNGPEKPVSGNSPASEQRDSGSAEAHAATDTSGYDQQHAFSGPPAPLTIAAVGASAGGIEAFSTLLGELPADTGLAIVFIQHLSPQHNSALAHLLGNATPMPVVQAEQDMLLQRDHVYVIPPGAYLGIDHGRFHLIPRDSSASAFLPIDHFLRALAEDAREHAIAVILSGTASDGADGLREIKATGGVVLAQKPDSARYDGMPRAAIDTGLVDRELSPGDIGKELGYLGHHPLLRHVRVRRTEDELQIGHEQMSDIFAHLRRTVGVDFTHYKPGTIKRRLQRRMLLNRLPDVYSYIKYLKQHPQEAEGLYQDVLIHVTRFFREPETFEGFRQNILPKLLEGGSDTIRIWVPGCSSGEEAYSVAILLLEELEQRKHPATVQIFGTDLSEPSVIQARRGIFTASISEDVGEQRLRRYFQPSGDHYQISKQVRDLCVFARQDITRDPPFSRLDLVMCRNVLIYLNTSLQNKVLSIFHYALRPGGFLILGAAESVGPTSELFSPLSEKQRIYTRLEKQTRPARFPLQYGGHPDSRNPSPRRPATPQPSAEAEQLLLDIYAPVAVVVNQDLRIVHTRGKTGAYLELAAGDPDLNVLKMARKGLLQGLRNTLQHARHDRQPARSAALKFGQNGATRTIQLMIYPLHLQESPHFLIAFEELPSPLPERDRARKTGDGGGDGEQSNYAERVCALEDELKTNREYLEATVHDLEAANEELQSANEEILSSNEELQSTNAELDTAKEELQSANEELNTVNDELTARNDELSSINSDQLNLLANIDLAIVMVGDDLRIRRMTPMAERVLNLLPSDIGRPISHIRPSIDGPGLEQQIAHVIDRKQPLTREVRDDQGRWYRLSIHPYRTKDNRIEGAVLALVNTDADEQHKLVLQSAHQAILQCVAQPVLVLDKALRVLQANQPFLQFFQIGTEDTVGHHLYQLGNGQWDIPELRHLLEQLLTHAGQIDHYPVSHDFPSIGQRELMLCARAIQDGKSGVGMILLTITELDANDDST